MSKQLLVLGLVACAVVLATLALVESVWGEPSPQVLVGSGQQAAVEWVLPGGPAWRAGIRDGQTVISLHSGIDLRSWHLVTWDGVLLYSAPFEGMEGALRDDWPLALMAIGMTTAAVVAFRRQTLAAALAVGSIAVAAQVLLATGQVFQSSAAIALGLIAIGLWLWAWSERGATFRVASLMVFSSLAVAWLVVRALTPSAFDAVESVRQIAIGLGAAGIVILLLEPKHWRDRLTTVDGGHWADLVAVAAVLSVAVFVAVLTELPLMLLAVVGGLVVLAYPRLRHHVADAIDDVLLSGQRNRVSLQAVEDERGRIARDLHDAPLQEISAVIRDLERQGGSDRQADALRGVAGHLRRVTTELRPPVLDDLGLGAAVSFLVAEANASGSSVEVTGTVTPDDVMAPRPPRQVELAVFRIVQEAVENALHHSGASSVAVTALVEPGQVVVSVQDDGIGLASDARRRALQGGHIGLSTMAQRAALIGAKFEIASDAQTGTNVRVAWRATA